MQREQGGGDDRAETFAEALHDLKQTGSMLLVVGTADAQSFDAACDRLDGDDTGDRRRVRITTETGANGTESSVEDRTIAYATASRSTATGSGAAASPSPDAVVDGSLGDLQEHVDRAVDDLRPDDGFDPADLRVCLDSIDAVLSEHDQEQVFQFLHALAGRMRETRGMCHVHLPVAFDDEHVQVLAPLFDALIEIRPGGQQRWHLVDPAVTTEWLSV